MQSETFKKLKELMDQIQTDADKAFQKGTTSRARNARKNLSELSKLCKSARKELLDVIHQKKEKE